MGDQWKPMDAYGHLWEADGRPQETHGPLQETDGRPWEPMVHH